MLMSTSGVDFELESDLWKRNHNIVGGIDEVGRGAFAGPVFASCVCFTKDICIPNDVEINDSKKLTQKRRVIAYTWIINNAFIYGVGKGSVAEINRFGLGITVKRAIRRAVTSAQRRSNFALNYLLLDAFKIPQMKNFPVKGGSRQLAIIKGDEKSFSIAAASIVAKVERDQVMQELGSKSMYKKYGWMRNKGYGTLSHRKHILRYGNTPHHRTEFVNTFLENWRE
jgi:ribonuclease HII